MGDRSNRSLAFPVVAPGGGSALVRVTVRLDEGEEGFRFAQYSRVPAEFSDIMAYFRDNHVRKHLPDQAKTQRNNVRVNFNPEERRSYVGESYGMLAILADTLAATRPELFGRDYDAAQTELAIVATGMPEDSGALVLNDAGQNVGGLEAKLRAVLTDGEEMFGEHDQKLLVVPRQAHEGDEAALLTELKAKGWKVVETSDLDEDIRGGLLAPEGDKTDPAAETQGCVTWSKIGAGACLAVALFAFGLWQGRVEPPVSASLLVAEPAPAPEPVSAAPQEAVKAELKETPVVYSGALSVGVKLVRGEKTYDAPVGNPFMPGETVRLIVSHTGERSAFAVLYRGQVPVKNLELSPGKPVETDFTVQSLADSLGQATISIADCSANDCAATKSKLLESVGQAKRSYPVGNFGAVQAEPGAALTTILKFEMM